MKPSAIILLSIGGLVVAQSASAQEADPSRGRDAAARALIAIQKAQESWYTTNKQVCASCHHQYQPALAYRVARDHGVPFNESITRADAAKAFNFSDIDRAIQYSYVIEPSVDDAYRMVAANAAGVKPNLGTAIYARLLISRQNARGDWDGFHQRPPSSYINLLLDRGAQVAVPAGGASVFNANPFFLASYAGNAKSLKRLLAAGGKLDEAMIAIGTSRTTALLGAFKFGDIEVARTLLDLGAQVDFADGNGITMLDRAALNNDIEMARMLIARGATVNVVDKMGMTPLLWAANIDFGETRMIELLLQSGARADVRNTDGLTPLELARKWGHANLIPALSATKATN